MTTAPASGGEVAEVLAEVRRVEALSRRLVRDLVSGGYATVFRGAGLEPAGVREYAEGDDMRAVDWNVTARTGRPHVRTYADERDLRVWFVADRSLSMERGGGAWSQRQAAARVVASLALAAAWHDDETGLVTFGEPRVGHVPLAKGAAHVLRILREVIVPRAPEPHRSRAADALSFLARISKRRSVVFVVSDFLGDGWKEALAPCRRRNDVVAVRLLAPERTAPRRGVFRVRDPESGREELADFGSERVRAAWNDRSLRQRARVDAAFRALRIDRIDVPLPLVADPLAVVRPLRAFFSMREARGEKR